MSLANQNIRNVSVNFGPQKIEPQYGADIDEKVIKVMQWSFKYDTLPKAGTWNMEAVIPANASIVRVIFQVIEAFTSTSTTTDLQVGLAKKDGTVISATGLITATQADQTAIAVVGKLIRSDVGTAGALINTTIGADPAELVVTPTVDDLLTGRGRIIVEYLDKGFTKF